MAEVHPVRPAGYLDVDAERYWTEAHRSRRSDFARDRARVLHSAALRQLSAKTQVLSPASPADFARNRLTHSLEVAQVGRELAAALGLAEDVVDAACLGHDLGHPPFGHNGERALNEWAADIGGFEGNAQSFRIVTRLESKAMGPDRSYGLNLTRATLDAVCKYPWTMAEAAEQDVPGLKFGVYPDDEDVFDWMREGSPRHIRCVEAQAMDLSDDIAYSVHDVEDAIVNGYLDLEVAGDPSIRPALLGAIRDWVGESYQINELDLALTRLQAMPSWPASFDRSRRDLANLKNFSSDVIGRFVSASVEQTLATAGDVTLVRYGGSVDVPRDVRAEIAVLKGLIGATVVTITERRHMYREQRQLLVRIGDALLSTDVLWSNGADELDPEFAHDFLAARDDATRKRVVVDQVASLTDITAVSWHRRLIGEIDPAEVGIVSGRAARPRVAHGSR